MLLLISSAICVVVISYFLTEKIRRYAIQNTIMDMPNHRSSHKIPTPRGGGLVIVISALVGFLYLAFSSYLTLKESIAVIIPLLIVSILAWQDDKKHIASIVRAVCYFIAASCLIFLIDIKFSIIKPLISNIALAVGVVWIINLNNFMDGIDGIAGIEALTTLLFASVVFYQFQDFSLFLVSIIIAASVLGFLFLNWPPAKIFMGDVGSCSIGLLYCVIALLAFKKHDISLLIWLILLSVFITDATLTLTKRILTGQKWYAAHKQHAYQLLTQVGYSHKQVTLSILAINIFLLWPLSYLALTKVSYMYHCFFLAYFFLAGIWIYIIFYLENKHQDSSSAH